METKKVGKTTKWILILLHPLTNFEIIIKMGLDLMVFILEIFTQNKGWGFYYKY